MENIIDVFLKKYNIKYDWVLTNSIDEICYSIFILKEDFIKNEEFLKSILLFKYEEQKICGIDFYIINEEYFDNIKMRKILK